MRSQFPKTHIKTAPPAVEAQSNPLDCQKSLWSILFMRLSAKVLSFPSSSEKLTQESKAPTLKSRIVNLASSDRLDVRVTIFIFSRASKFSLSPRAEIKQNSHMLPVSSYFMQFPEPAGHWLHFGGCRQWWACGQSAWQNTLLAPRRLQFLAFQFSCVVKYFDFSNLPE